MPGGGAAGYRERLYARYKETHARSASPTPGAFRYEARVHAKVFGPLLPADREAEVFELGCGSGSFLHYLQGAGYRRSSGMDQDPAHAETARSMGVRGVAAGDGLSHLAGKPGSYDCVVAIDVLEHLRKDELFGALETIRAALRPGGLFLWRAPNADGPFSGRIRYGDLTHELAFTRESARQAMAAAGFSEVRVLPEGPVVTGLRSALRRLLWLLFSAAARLYLFAESCAQDSLLTANLIVSARRPREGA